MGLERLDTVIKNLEFRSDKTKFGVAQSKNTMNGAFVGRPKLDRGKSSQPVKTYFRKNTIWPNSDFGIGPGPVRKVLVIQDSFAVETVAKPLEKGEGSRASLKPVDAPDFSAGGPTAPMCAADTPELSASRLLLSTRAPHVLPSLQIVSASTAKAPTKVASPGKGPEMVVRTRVG